MRIVAFVNGKGGVGKSTLAVHLCAWAHDRGDRVALLDADKQRSSSTWLAEVEPAISIRFAASPEEALAESQSLANDHDLLVADGPAGLDEISRSLLLLADVAIFPLTPSILDMRSVEQATAVLRYAQTINKGRPDAWLVLNRFRTRDRISAELRQAAEGLGVRVADNVVRDLQVYRDAAQQGTVVTRMGRRTEIAAGELAMLFSEILAEEAAGRSFRAADRGAVANG